MVFTPQELKSRLPPGLTHPSRLLDYLEIDPIAFASSCFSLVFYAGSMRRRARASVSDQEQEEGERGIKRRWVCLLVVGGMKIGCLVAILAQGQLSD